VISVLAKEKGQAPKAPLAEQAEQVAMAGKRRKLGKSQCF
jgi:hypothetical protein